MAKKGYIHPEDEQVSRNTAMANEGALDKAIKQAQPIKLPQPTYVQPEDVAGNTQDIAPQPVVAPVVPAPVVEAPQPSKSDEILSKMYASREPAPVVDQAQIDRVQRMGRINSTGRSLGVLGDMLTLGLGGNVRRREPDRVAPALYSQYEGIMSKNKAEQDAWKLRDFKTQRDNWVLALNDESKKDGIRLRNAQMKAQGEREQRAADLKMAEFLDKRTQDEKDRLYKVEQDAKKGAREDKRIAISQAKGNKGNGKDPIVVQTSSGKNYTLSPEEYSRRIDEVVGSEAIAKNPKYSKYFTPVERMAEVPDSFGAMVKKGTGVFDYKWNKDASPKMRAQISLEQEEEKAKATPQTASNTKDGYLVDGQTKQSTVQKLMPNGKVAIFDSTTKKFIQWQ
jgi:hypothetical protein